MQIFTAALCSLQFLCIFWQPLQVKAWKPIVDPARADHVITSSSYSIKQSHPDFSKSYAAAELKSNKPILVAPTGLEGVLETSPETPISVKALHITTYDDDFDDFDPTHVGYEDGESRFLTGHSNSQCSAKKFAFNHDGTVVYNNKIPELQQFTVCYWLRFTNHSGDHVILTYATKNEPRAMQFWIANSKNVSYISMAIKGQQMYRLNYPFRMRRWHHTCSSWNGKTGEWQVWVKGERIGRGFHNSLVGHVIPSHGKLYSGGTSATGEISEGLHFEITLVQIYRIALSAGKAHRDHKHHHVHMVDYEGQEVQTTTRPPPPINRPQPMHQLLANGQIPTRVRINLARPAASASPNPAFAPLQAGQDIVDANGRVVTFNTNYVNGQRNNGALLVSQQIIGQPAGPRRSFRQRPNLSQRTFTQQVEPNGETGNLQFVDETETRILFKRQTDASKSAESAKKKRDLVYLSDGTIVQDTLVNGINKYDGLAEFGGQKFKDDLNVRMSLDDEIADHDREPAEEEVKAVMNLCSACDPEPFKGAIVLAWNEINEQMDNALKGVGSGKCGDF